MRNYTPDPRLYELVTILSPDVSDDDIPGQLDTITGYVTTAGGSVTEVLRESPWGRRRLAYTIRNSGRDLRDGYYTVFHLTLDPGGVVDIERELKLNDQIIRYLITHYTPRPLQPGQQPEGGEAVPAAATEAAPAQTDAAAPAVATASAPEVPAAAAPATDEAASGEAAAPTQPETEAAAVVEPQPENEAAPEPETEPESTASESAEPEAPAEPAAESEPETAAAADEPPVVAEAEADPVDDASGASAETVDATPVVAETSDTEATAADISDIPSDFPVEADAAPADPTAPAKDTEEA